MQVHSDRSLNMQAVSIADLKPGGATLAVLTGTSDVARTDLELSAPKSFVESGGWLVIDDCGGSGKFAGSIESQWLPKLADAKPQPIPDSDPLLADLSPKYREGTTQRLGNSVKPKWLTIGKGKIIYSPIDYTTGLLGAILPASLATSRRQRWALSKMCYWPAQSLTGVNATYKRRDAPPEGGASLSFGSVETAWFETVTTSRDRDGLARLERLWAQAGVGSDDLGKFLAAAVTALGDAIESIAFLDGIASAAGDARPRGRCHDGCRGRS